MTTLVKEKKKLSGQPRLPRTCLSARARALRTAHLLERPKIPPNLLLDLRLLDLDRHLAPVRQPRPMHLGHARARARGPLHDALTLGARPAHAKHLLRARTAKVVANHLLDLVPAPLRRIVKHATEHLLELGRQHRALHGNGLPDLQVQAAVVPQQLEHALGRPAVQRLDAAGGAKQRQRVRAEVELVVEGDAEARVEGAQRAREARGRQLAVGEVEGAGDGGEEEQAAGPFGGAAEGARGLRGAEGGRGWGAVDGGEGA